MPETPATLKRQLVRQYRTFEGLDDPGYFEGLADYVRFVRGSDTLRKISEKRFNTEKKRLDREAERLSKEASYELWKLIVLLQKDCKDLPEHSADFKSAKAVHDVSHSEIWRAGQYESILRKILKALFADGREEIWAKYATIKEHSADDIDVSIKSPAYIRYVTDVVAESKLKERDSIWGAWQKLLELYRLRHAFGELPYSDHRELEEYNDRCSELNELLDFHPFQFKKKNETFHKSKYAYPAGKVHEELVSALDEDADFQPRLLFDPDKQTLRFKNKEARLSSNSRPLTLVKFLAEGKNDPWRAAEIIEQQDRYGSLTRPFKERKDVYDTYRNLRTRLGVKTGEDFPIYMKENRYIWSE
ncbi:MAG: hypothetical protein WD846_04005 [Patescibacteria group bacterium]